MQGQKLSFWYGLWYRFGLVFTRRSSDVPWGAVVVFFMNAFWKRHHHHQHHRDHHHSNPRV
eukprot:8762798-Karenia_brevis.AAC.1